MKKQHILAAMAAALAFSAAAQVPTAPSAPSSTLQGKCIELVKPTLKGTERIRDIGQKKGAVDQDVMFKISDNGGPSRTVACEVQSNGTLKLANK